MFKSQGRFAKVEPDPFSAPSTVYIISTNFCPICLQDNKLRQEAARGVRRHAQSIVKAQDAASIPPYDHANPEKLSPYLHHLKGAILTLIKKQPGIRAVDLDTMFSADRCLPWWNNCLSDLRNEQKLIYWPDLDKCEDEGEVRCWFYGGPWRVHHNVWPPAGAVAQDFLKYWPQESTLH